MISNTTNRTLLAVAGTVYDFTFRIDDDSELLVYGVPAVGDSVLLTTGFTISFDSENEEGTVTFSVEPSTYAQILMLRSKAYTQNTDIPIRSGFSEEDIENALDHIVMLIQQVKEITDYCVRLDLTSDSSAPTLPDPVEGNALIWDADGNLVNSDAVLVGPTGPTGATGAAGAAGIFSAIASQAEAEAGSDNAKGMTPLRTAQAIAAVAGVSFDAESTAGQAIGAGSEDKVQFNSEVSDSGGYYDPTTNYRFTPLVAGKYYIYAKVRMDSMADNKSLLIHIKKNGSSVISYGQSSADGLNLNIAQCGAVINFNGTTDYVEVFASNGDSSSRNVSNDPSSNTFCGFKVSS